MVLKKRTITHTHTKGFKMLTFEKMQSTTEIELMERIAQEIWREYSPCFISEEQIEYMLGKFQSTEAIKQQLKDKYEYYFIKKDDNIAGYFAIQPQEKKLFLSNRNNRRSVNFACEESSSKVVYKILYLLPLWTFLPGW